MIQGKWQAQGSAAQTSATLGVEANLFTIETENGLTFSGKLGDVIVSDRLGNVERKLTLADGSIFATHDNDAVDNLFKDYKNISRFIHAFESSLSWVAIAVVVIIISTFAFFKWGIPWTSTKIAHALPHQANQLIAAHTLDFLDDFIFDKSQLDTEKMAQIRAHFKSKLVPLDQQNTAIKYQLHFRQWGEDEQAIPNALALPSGDIILTDKFVELSENQDEIDAVLLHEMGHIINRHTLEMVIEGTLVTTIVMMVTGDSNGLADMGLGLGSLLVSSHYSRNHESEADAYAFTQMLIAKIDPVAFSNIMNRMTRHLEDTKKIRQDDAVNTDRDNSFLDYLSSHPSTAERVQQANQFSDCFKKGLITCTAKEK